MAGTTVHVIGAGMVGVCTALELQARGALVTLLDRREPGRETSWGNAGVIARSSLVPLNNPSLWRSLPGLLGNRRAALRYDLRYLLKNPGWALGFLANARASTFHETTQALDGLIRLSIDIHRERIAEVGQLHRLSDAGWLTLYRSETGYARARSFHEVMTAFGVDTVTLSRADLTDLEPSLKPVFDRALWVRDSLSVDDPGAIVAAYAGRFAQAGGQIVRAEVTGIRNDGDAVKLSCADGDELTCGRAVICLGPWARDLVERMGCKVPLGYERGYHRHFCGGVGAAPNSGLQRPVHDSAGGYVLSPMARGLRLSTGVELSARDAVPNPSQMDQAERAARQAIDLGEAIDPECWLGSRPTLPDSRPAIGPMPKATNVWASFGHQHIGFSTGPGSARLLADLMEGRTPPIPAAPFRPDRFIRAR
ncbi:NAD(P)/FAD-dependent oxidoreductase [Roseibium hamelinense]|uniref:NAD(P)/FAD-dependent oxidoreductase n=1 Tax=Roseibium hamelinense TaxID=150831 RepID=UPI001AD942E8|nr:FAD-binding oxidoreductase [Roseibium hamelinense]